MRNILAKKGIFEPFEDAGLEGLPPRGLRAWRPAALPRTDHRLDLNRMSDQVGLFQDCQRNPSPKLQLLQHMNALRL